MTAITIPYHPRYPQTEIHPQLESHRFNVLVTHRQLGKTVCAVNHLLKSALQNPRPKGRYFYVGPQLKQVKIIAWDYLKTYTRPLPGVKVNEFEMSVVLPTGAKVWLLGSDNPDNLRGTYADGVVLDEFGDIKPNLYHEIIRPMLVSRKGWVLFFGTPKGQNHFYSLFQTAVKEYHDNPKGDWWAGLYRADQTGVISPEELADIKANTPESIFRQEYLCDFTASSANVLIPIDKIIDAQKRLYKEGDLRGAPRVLGVDVARFGDDRSIIFPRVGLQAYAPKVFTGLDNMDLASRVAEEINTFNPDAVFVDAGQGSGVIDRLHQLGYGRVVVEVPFGSRPIKEGKYTNKRAEMWGEMGEWIKNGGALPAEPAELAGEMSLPTYDFDVAGKLRLESKDGIKKRLGASPDLADALALTFAAPVQNRERAYGSARREQNYEVTLGL